MNQILILWGEKVRSAVNGLKKPTREQILKVVFFGVGGILFILFDYFFFKRIITILLSPKAVGGLDIELVGHILIDRLMGMINLTLFSVLVFSNVVASLSTLYLSRDLELVLSCPISHTRVFIAKFVQATLNSSYMVILFGLPIYFALGSAFGVGPTYYVGMVFLLVPFIFIPAGIGAFVTMLLLRFFPAKRTHQVMTFLGMVFAAGLIFFFRYLRPETLYQDLSDLSQPTFMAVLEGFKVPQYPFLPSTWLSHVINEMVGLESGVLELNLSFLIIGAAVSFCAVVAIARLIYFSGFSKSFESKGRGTVKKARGLTGIDRALAFLDTRQRGVLVKDIKTMFRDPTQWSQLFLLLALIIMYLFSIKNIPATTDFLKELTSFLNLGLTGFVISALAVRFIFPTTSLEGQAHWIIFSSPLSVAQFLWAKFFIYVIPVVFLGELLIVCSNIMLGVEPFMMILSTVTVLFFSLSLTAMGVGLGAVYPRFSYENAAEIAAGFGGIIYMITSLIYVGITIVIEARPVYIYFSGRVVPSPSGYEGLITSLIISAVLLVALNAAVFIVPMRLGKMRLERMEF